MAPINSEFQNKSAAVCILYFSSVTSKWKSPGQLVAFIKNLGSSLRGLSGLSGGIIVS